STTVIVVRHAEKVDDSRDPALSEAGLERAQALAAALEHAGVDAAYASQYRRTRLTAAPTAESAGLAVQIEPIEGDIPAWAQDFAAALAQHHAGETVLVAGHSNTVPPLVAALCGCEVDPLAEDDYDRLFVIQRVGEVNPALITARYGAE
ncbi:MAG: histidine phosphatase family protein, partial [Wenzhouxiangellaceae bacterium]|nr:histidine phosphatase family protein [Wenzhouxiangellaceae bacterium]